MIISHRLKFVFFRIPKTGSVSAETAIRLCGAFDTEDYMSAISGMPYTFPKDLFDPYYTKRFGDMRKGKQGEGRDLPPMDKDTAHLHVMSYLAHMTPKQAIKYNFITEEQLKEYKCYAFLRDPYDRHISAYSYQIGSVCPPDQYKELLKQGKFLGRNSVLYRRQVDYFLFNGEQICEPLLFENFTEEVHRVISVLQGYEFSEIPKLNASRADYLKDDYYDEEVVSILNKEFSEDMDFFQKNTKIKDWKPKDPNSYAALK